MAPAAHRRRSRSFRAAALVALASVSCTTVRVPASTIPDAVRIRGDVAEPQVELWVESGGAVSPVEAAIAAAEARSALEQALAGRGPADGGQVLVVRAQGVSRTGSRKTDQVAAAAGLVVAAFAIIAVAVVVLVASRGGRGGSASGAQAAPASAPRAPPAVAAPARVPAPAAVPRPGPGARPVVPAPARPASGHSGGGVGFAVGAGVQVGGPAPDAPPPAEWSESVAVAPQAPGPVPEAEPPLAPAEAPAPDPAAEPWPAELVLPAPPPLDVGRRGFFARDSTRLEVTLVDRATLAPLWVKVVESKDDPRDAEAMRKLVDRALSDPEGWEAAPAPWTPAPPPGA